MLENIKLLENLLFRFHFYHRKIKEPLSKIVEGREIKVGGEGIEKIED